MQIVNEAEFFPKTIQSNASEVFQVRLPWVTGNEFIEQEQGQHIDYFMNVSYEIANQEIELRNIYSSNNKVILATKDQYLGIASTNFSLENEFISFENNITGQLDDLKEITDSQNFGDLIFFTKSLTT